MATLSFSVAGPTLDLAVALQIADTDAPRIMAYLMASSYGTVTENVQTTAPDASWNPDEAAGETEADRPTVTTQAWVTRQATAEEAAANYARSVLDSLLVGTVAHEKAQAAAAASEGVAPIAVVGG